MLDFPKAGVKGVAFNLEENSVGVIILGDYKAIAEGDEVRSHRRRSCRCPWAKLCSAALSIRWASHATPKARSSPSTLALSKAMPPASLVGSRWTCRMQTGIKAIDAMTPVGRGQRELIIGDRKTGKTAIAIDTIINQRGNGVKCVYVAIGQKDSTVAKVVREPTG